LAAAAAGLAADFAAGAADFAFLTVAMSKYLPFGNQPDWQSCSSFIDSGYPWMKRCTVASRVNYLAPSLYISRVTISLLHSDT
jgi:hypothetical protein